MYQPEFPGDPLVKAALGARQSKDKLEPGCITALLHWQILSLKAALVHHLGVAGGEGRHRREDQGLRSS